MHRSPFIRMSSVAFAAGILATLLGAGPGRADESYLVVRITDMTKEDSYEVMTATEFKELEKTIQLETRYYPQAEAAAAKAWREDELNKHVPFPGARLAPRKVEMKAQFAKKDEAQTKLQQLEERESKKADRETQMMADLNKKNPQQAKSEKERQDKEAEKKHDAARASEIVQANLKELIEKAGGKTAVEGTQPPAHETAKKAAEKAM